MKIIQKNEKELAIDFGEECQRCNEKGEDRRTLKMACFYAMDELGLPFQKIAIDGYYKEFSHEEQGQFGPRAYFKSAEGAAREHQMYTLRVCKSCRASWMKSIKAWFLSPASVQPATGTGIYRRDFGHIVEASAAEVDVMLQVTIKNNAEIVKKSRKK